MKLLALISLASLALSPVAASAAEAKATPSLAQCFYIRDMRNHTVGDAHTMYFDVAGREVYKVTMSNACLAGAVSSDPILMRNHTGSSQICTPLDLDITVDAAGPSRCLVSTIAKLTPAEVAALPKKVKP